MKQGVYLGPEDVDSVSAGHLVLTTDGAIARATTIHPSDAPIKGLVEAAAKLGWFNDRTPDGHFFWRHEKGERRWTDPTLQVWVSSHDPVNRQFWTHAETRGKTLEEPYIFEAQWRPELRMHQVEAKQPQEFPRVIFTGGSSRDPPRGSVICHGTPPRRERIADLRGRMHAHKDIV